MLPHQWSMKVADRFRKENNLDGDAELIGEPTMISDTLLFDDASMDGEKLLGELGLKLYNPHIKQVLNREFTSAAVYITMADDARTFYGE